MIWKGDYGFLPIAAPGPYDQAYFDKYVGYAHTPMGQDITWARAQLVVNHTRHDADVLDIGIGCGAFLVALKKFRHCIGFDVNPAAVEWMKRERLWVDGQLVHGAAALTFWDSLEHIEDPWPLINRAQEEVFISIPIFRDEAHALNSKHYRPTEHFWYFTHDGLVREMRQRGFSLILCNNMESLLGREDISTFVFRRM